MFCVYVSFVIKPLEPAVAFRCLNHRKVSRPDQVSKEAPEWVLRG
jgi:hypothetical protein